MDFEIACSEISYIIDHMESSIKDKIPNKMKNFFKNNKSSSYEIKLTTEKRLEDQELRDETKAFLEIIKMKYLK